MTQCRKNLCTV